MNNRHRDGTTCAGQACAFRNDGGHDLLRPLEEVLYANMHDGQVGGTVTMATDDLVKETVDVITEYLVDDEFQGMLQEVAWSVEGDSNDDEIDRLREALEWLLGSLRVSIPDNEDIDRSSSASRQHRIDTGRYMTKIESEAAGVDA